jgi:Tol biopolymer transport system component
MAAPFDPMRLVVTGGSVALVADVMQAAYEAGSAWDTGAGQLALSDSGALAYIPGGVVPDAQRTLVWVDRNGKAVPLSLSLRSFKDVRLSPDGQRVAVSTFGMNMDLYVFEVARGNLTRLTTEGRNGTPVWSPDGTRLAYRSGRAGADNLYWQLADGSGRPERLTTSRNNQIPATWTPDSQGLIFYELLHQQSDGQRARPISRIAYELVDAWLLPLYGARTPRPILQSPIFKLGVDVSPDGRWLAYASTESDRPEVYVHPYDRPGPRVKVSADDGMTPVWRRDGRELFFIVPPDPEGRIQVMVAPVTTKPVLSIGTPTRLFEGNYYTTWPARTFDVTADGQRFLMIQDKDLPSVKISQIVLVQNWFEELKRLVPGK